MSKILVVEDEIHLAEGLKLNLSLKGYDVQMAHDGLSAINKWKNDSFDLIILDLMLPELDGFKVLEEIRLHNDRLPILILSARDAVEDKIRCLKKGVDDYLSKPFDLDEFLLRVERIIKRAKWSQEQADEVEPMLEYSFGNCHVDFETRSGKGAHEEVTLTLQELKLLRVLFENEGKSLSRKFLLENAFGYSVDATSRTVDNFIVRFRRYFEDNPKKPKHFVSKRAIGYAFKK